MANVTDGIIRLLKTISDGENISEYVNSIVRENIIYRDEPVPYAQHRASERIPDMPARYDKMKKIAKRYRTQYYSMEQIFFEQGKFMEDFEDDFQYDGKFERYFPTYEMMNDAQLRGYFSWRTKVRKGIIEPTSLSFAFVYIYELINRIGVKDAEDGFYKLKAFSDEYGQIDQQINRYMNVWLRDYIVYYDLNRSFTDFLPSNDIESAAGLLFDAVYGEVSQDALFKAIMLCSSYNIGKSRFYKEYPDDFADVACGVFLRLSEYHEKYRKTSFCEKLFGRHVEYWYDMFGTAVFFQQEKQRSREYIVNDICKYSCKKGQWTVERLAFGCEKSRRLGSIMKMTDCLMRTKYGFSHELKQEELTKKELSVIEKEIERVFVKKQKHDKKNAVSEVVIDFSKLSGIRQASDITRDKLLIDPELYDDLASEADVPDIPERMETPEADAVYEKTYTEDHSLLSRAECEFIKRLLYGGDFLEPLRSSGVMLSVAVDSINEKLFDTFGDIVIELAESTPVLIEDYIDVLKGIVG